MEPVALLEGLTFDDVLLLPGYADFLPEQADLSARLTRTLRLNAPVVSAAMDTVTEAEMAIALARLGGIGVIHRNMTAAAQAAEVAKVKQQTADHPLAARDMAGRLLVAAAVGAGDPGERATALRHAGVDVLVIDTAHGHSRNVIDALRLLKEVWPALPVIAGNIATGEAARDLIAAGADALKVGMGSGGICTTRIVAGIGVPQLTAIQMVAAVAGPSGVPVIADGGIRYAGDIPKAIAAGADTVMLGGLLARTRESPGEVVEIGGQAFKRYRGMGSLGALGNAANDRYGAAAPRGQVVPEGVEGLVPLEGSVAEVLHQLLGGLRKGMGYCGLRTIPELQAGGRFIRVSPAAAREGHPHSLQIAEQGPNYSRSGTGT